ncbi:hypothetical protein NKH18_15170 [Streptomyces sp. M10(2022)]
MAGLRAMLEPVEDDLNRLLETATTPAEEWDRMCAETDHRTVTVTDSDGMPHVLTCTPRRKTATASTAPSNWPAAGPAEGKDPRPGGLQPRPPGSLALDPQAVFRTEELRIILDAGFGDDVALQDEITREGGRLPPRSQRASHRRRGRLSSC